MVYDNDESADLVAILDSARKQFEEEEQLGDDEGDEAAGILR